MQPHLLSIFHGQRSCAVSSVCPLCPFCSLPVLFSAVRSILCRPFCSLPSVLFSAVRSILGRLFYSWPSVLFSARSISISCRLLCSAHNSRCSPRGVLLARVISGTVDAEHLPPGLTLDAREEAAGRAPPLTPAFFGAPPPRNAQRMPPSGVRRAVSQRAYPPVVPSALFLRVRPSLFPPPPSPFAPSAGLRGQPCLPHSGSWVLSSSSAFCVLRSDGLRARRAAPRERRACDPQPATRNLWSPDACGTGLPPPPGQRA
ncbi:hypothetical protein AcW1_002458 [Taiwanofungus camphoratus]|nr:hypothetical protein AcV5_009885 [Antrodia cinnamomea]KAI0943247.1 hypothetical protein AcW1_002458 [Antrodia cinnamomea]